ncbi:unnamed protein product [Rhizophagus irregularis]|nr:unnamed protein product [Rhizophagus irregularis]
MQQCHHVATIANLNLLLEVKQDMVSSTAERLEVVPAEGAQGKGPVLLTYLSQLPIIAMAHFHLDIRGVRKKPICYTEPASLQVRNISLFSHPEIFD